MQPLSNGEVMSGFSFVYIKKPSLKISDFAQRLKKTRYLDTFTTEVLHNDNQTALGMTKSFPDYPLSVFENNDYQIWMEGKIYNRSFTQIADSLLSFCKSICIHHNTGPLVKWLNHSDGEFLIFIYDKINHHWVIFRDILGRLPVYYCDEMGQFIISRDLRFVQKNARTANLARVNLAHFLLFGYHIQDKTFFRNIKKADPSVLFLLNQKSHLTMIHLREFNYEHKQYRFRSVKKNAKQLADIFVESCKNRAALFPRSIVKLSGGYDSRTIAAGLKAAGQSFSTDSWMAKDRRNILDFEMAKQLAQTLGVCHQQHVLGNCSISDVRTAYLLKSGVDELSHVYPIRYCNILQKTYGHNVLVFDGLAGDKVLPNLRPQKHQFTAKSLVNYIIHKNKIWPPEAVEALTGISQQDLRTAIEKVLESYSEISLSQKYVHWYIHHRAMRKFFEIEDRSRNFFWTGTPFLNPVFYNYAMNCPDTQKTNRFLYTAMIKKLCPAALEVPYAPNFGLKTEPIKQYASRSFQNQLKCQQVATNIYRNITKHVFHKKAEIQPIIHRPEITPSWITECVQQQIKRPEVLNYFSSKHLKEIISHSEKWNPQQLGYLLTAITIIEEFKSNRLTIDEFAICHEIDNTLS